MRGFPNVFSTKQDYYNAKKLFPAETKKAVQELMEARFIWTELGELIDGGIVDTEHKIENTEIEEADGSRRPIKMQFKRVEDSNAEFYRLGWTLTEASAFLGS